MDTKEINLERNFSYSELVDYLKKNGRENEFVISKCSGCCKACDHAH